MARTPGGPSAMAARSRLLGRVGGTRAGVWAIKHVISPLDRWLYPATGDRAGQMSAEARSERPTGPLPHGARPEFHPAPR
jgi:hypothetical protein